MNKNIKIILIIVGIVLSVIIFMEDTIKIEYIMPIDFNFSKKSLQNEDL